jgi:hypothetical protein
MKDITMGAMPFYALLVGMIILGMLMLWLFAKFMPNTVFGVSTSMRDRIANRLSEMRYRRQQGMM